MIRRKRIPVSKHCGIGITTERMKDSGWAVVATVTHSTGTAEQKFNLPVPTARFNSQPAAETHGVKMAWKWIDENTLKSAARSRMRRGVTGKRRKAPAAKRTR